MANKEKKPNIPQKQIFTFIDGKEVLNEGLSEKMEMLRQIQPESPGDNGEFYEWQDYGLAELFARLFMNECRFCPGFKSWYVFDGGRWVKDVESVIVSGKVADFVRLLNIYCQNIPDEDVRENYGKYIHKIGDRRARDRIMKDAKSNMTIDAEQFDQSPYLINCLNGTYDLKTNKFYHAKAEDFITKQTHFNYTRQKNAKSDLWIKFIDDITEHNKDKSDYIQRALGYSILGKSNEECMFILHGKTTRNGKSTLLNTIEYMLGDYATVSPVGIICKGRKSTAENASPMIMNLKGRRFVTMAESDEYGKLDEEVIKQLTGGEKITGRALYQNAVTFLPQFTLWLSCNDLPAVTDKSLFASDRIRVIEFTKHFSQKEQDKNLKNKLTTPENMKGIFAWLIEGYKKYQKQGLVMSDDMQRVVRKYESDNDVVLQFLMEKCERVPESSIKAKDLYREFKLWLRAEGYPVKMSIRKFNDEMERHIEFYDEITFPQRYRTYKGCAIRHN